MRNLKRALSLALASVMLLGMMVVGTSAASYPDVKDSDNVEAIEVLNAVGVMIGDRGNFRPDAAVNRHEMAAITARLLLGEDAETYTGSHPFTDVYPWADKYVAACYEYGVINGTSKTTYSGNQPLTAVQAAAIMLRALGYEDLIKGATDWRAPIVKQANLIQLFKGVASSPNAQLNRNQVAQLALNTLKSDVVVTHDNKFEINADNVTVDAGQPSYEAIKLTGEGAKNYAGASGAGEGYQQLCEKLYDTKLKMTGTYDDFGRPATKWTYKNKTAVTAANDADVTYTDEVKLATIYKDLGLSGNVAFTYYEDNSTATTTDPYDHGTVSSAISSSEKIGGNGVLVDAYKEYDGTGNFTGVRVCVVNTYAGKVTRVNPAKDATERSITISGAAGTFETEGFAKDDIVLYTKSGSTIKTVTLAEKVADQTITSYTGNAATASKLVADSTYKLAAKGTHKDAIAIDSSYDLYLDNYGYVIYSELYAAGSSDYAYVLDANDDGLFSGSATHMVQLLLADGTIVEGKADKDYKTGVNDLRNHVVTYRLNKDNEYELTDKGVGQNDASYPSSPISVTMEPNKSTITTAGGTINANSSTVFVVGTNDGTANGKYTYTVYTGIANAPKINTSVRTIAADNGAVAKYVFIRAASSAVSSDADKTIFVKGASKGPSKAITVDGVSYYEYDAVENGEKITLKVKTSAAIVATLANNTWLKQVTVDKDGYITAAVAYSGTYNPASPSTAGVVGPTTGTNREGDAVRMGYVAGVWYTLKKDAPVVVVDGDDIYPGDVTNVEESDVDSIYAVAKDGQITAMTIVRDGRAAVTAPVTEGTVMDKVTEDDISDNPAFAGAAQYVVEGLTAATDASGNIVITGTVPVAKQFTNGSVAGSVATGTNVNGFGDINAQVAAATNSTKAAIIPIQAADGGIILYLVGDYNATQSMTTPINIVKNESGVNCNLNVKFSLTWATP